MANFQFSEPMAVTLTLQPRWYRFEPDEQLALFMAHFQLKYATKPWLKSSVIAELTNRKNVHFHCLFSINEKKLIASKYSLKTVITNLFRRDRFIGFIQVTDIVNLAGWVEYMRKDMQTSELKYQVINDNFEIAVDYEQFDIMDAMERFDDSD